MGIARLPRVHDRDTKEQQQHDRKDSLQAPRWYCKFIQHVHLHISSVLFTVLLLRNRGVRLPWRDAINGPRYVGQLTTYSVDIDGERYNVATLRPVDPMGDALVPDLYEPALVCVAVQAFRLRGFERAESARGAFGAVQEWHCGLP
jgi:hypothetical protein